MCLGIYLSIFPIKFRLQCAMIKIMTIVFVWLILPVIRAKFIVHTTITDNAETEFCNSPSLLGLFFNGKVFKATTKETKVEWGAPSIKTRAYYFNYNPVRNKFTNYKVRIESDDEYKDYVTVAGIYFAHRDAYLEVYRAMRNRDPKDTLSTLAYNVFYDASQTQPTQLADLHKHDRNLFHLRGSGRIANKEGWKNDFFPEDFVTKNQHVEKVKLGSNEWVRLGLEHRIVLFASHQTANMTLCNGALYKAVLVEEDGEMTYVYCIDLERRKSVVLPFHNLEFQIIGIFEHRYRRYIMGKNRKMHAHQPQQWVHEFSTFNLLDFATNSSKEDYVDFFNCYDKFFTDSVAKAYIYIAAVLVAIVVLVAVFQCTSRREPSGERELHNKRKSLWNRTRLKSSATTSTIGSKYLKRTSTDSVYFDADKKKLDDAKLLVQMESEAKRVMSAKTRSELAYKLKD